jgi:kynureninase
VKTAEELDRSDPLAAYRDHFVGAESSLIYFDGNSLGRPLKVTGPRLRGFVELEWGDRLIRGWDEGWMELPGAIGDDLGRVVLGAAAGQTIVGDSTTVLLYKLLRSAAALRPGRSEIVVDRDNFPTDRYVAEGVAREHGMTLRWVDPDPSEGITADLLGGALGPQTAVVLLSHVAYKSAWVADVPTLTAMTHDAGALVVWDLCHSAGALPVLLDEWDVDLAVGCTYKYLNGGPGSPAFCYVAAALIDEVSQPIQGWMGASEPFLMGPTYLPAPGIRRMLSGTPPVVGMLALQDMLALIERAGIDAVRSKSVGLTEHAIALADRDLPDVEVASPRDRDRRGGHVTLRHPRMREVTAALWRRDVLPDYREPDGLRLGLSPLSTSYAEVERGIAAIRQEFA